MQSGDLITRCPHCNTTFRVTENQFEVAGSAVRCGSCLEIFTARNHIIELNTSAAQEHDPLSGTRDVRVGTDVDDESVEPTEVALESGSELGGDIPSSEEPLVPAKDDRDDDFEMFADDPFFSEDDDSRGAGHASEKTFDDEDFIESDGGFSELDPDGANANSVSFSSESDEIRTLDEMSVMGLDIDTDKDTDTDTDRESHFDEAETGPSDEITDDTNWDSEEDRDHRVYSPDDEDTQGKLFALSKDDTAVGGGTPSPQDVHPLEDAASPQENSDSGSATMDFESDWPHPEDDEDEDPFGEGSDWSDDAKARLLAATDDGRAPGTFSARDDDDQEDIDVEPYGEAETLEIAGIHEEERVHETESEPGTEAPSFSDHLDHYLQEVTAGDESDSRGQESRTPSASSAEAAYRAAEEAEDLPLAPSGAPEEIDAAHFAEQIKKALQDQPPEDPIEDVEERPLDDVPRVSGWWWSAVVALTLLLFGQWMWSDRETLAQDETLRPAYLSVCSVIGCEVSAFNDPDKLTAGDLVVRQVPEKPGVLHVDAIIRNDAGFRQPFPVVYLRFSSVRGDALAARRFAPSDYLAGEMNGVRMIPAQTEVRISLSVIDPGAEALGYSLELMPDGVPFG
ncbi:MAG: DUF3426 domain-containing protein [Gammaproteobacteria bacterium TMED50]|nr:MAG: DUF3426 domain-containing protein [Gammaproteobacteria bacterium TMED50]